MASARGVSNGQNGRFGARNEQNGHLSCWSASETATTLRAEEFGNGPIWSQFFLLMQCGVNEPSHPLSVQKTRFGRTGDEVRRAWDVIPSPRMYRRVFVERPVG